MRFRGSLAKSAAALAPALIAAATAQAGIIYAVDIHSSMNTPLPPAQRVNTNAAVANFDAQISSKRVVSFEASEGVTASFTYPAPASGPGINPAISFGGGILATVTNAVVRFQAPGTAGPDSQPEGRYPSDGTQFISATAAQCIVQFNQPVTAFGFYGIDVGDFGSTLTVRLSGGGSPTREFSMPPVSSDGSLSGTIMFFSHYDPSAPFTTVTLINSDTSDVFSYDQFMVGTAVPAPGGAALLTPLALAASRRRRR